MCGFYRLLVRINLRQQGNRMFSEGSPSLRQELRGIRSKTRLGILLASRWLHFLNPAGLVAGFFIGNCSRKDDG
jgi:hypothetical protein